MLLSGGAVVRRDVDRDGEGPGSLRHPLVGDLTVDYETLQLPGDPHTTVFAYSVEPNSPSARALGMLASWSLTPHPSADRPV